MKVNTELAVRSALDHLLDMIRLNRGDNQGLREMVPALYLRLGQDQECYDFAKFWQELHYDSSYDYRDMDAPFLHIKDADVFEPPTLFTKTKYPSLSKCLAVMLIKIRLFIDLQVLEHANKEVGRQLPPELLEPIIKDTVRSVVRRNLAAISRKDLPQQIDTLDSEIRELHAKVHKANEYFWLMLLHPEEYIDQPPRMYTFGSAEEAHLHVRYNYNAWSETSGAMEVARELTRVVLLKQRDEEATAKA